jgi:hypothetical protein
MAMREDARRRQDTRTYRRWDLGYGGDQEPDDTLMNENHINKVLGSHPTKTAEAVPVSKEGVPNLTCPLDGADGTCQGA